MIPHRRLGQTDLSIPELGFGGAPLGELRQRLTEAQAEATLSAAWQAGWRYFDTAPWYGHGLSEHRIGHWLRQQPPDAFLCSTKVGRVYRRYSGPAREFSPSPWSGGLPFELRFDYSYEGILRSYEDSLMRLGIPRVQALVIHDLDEQYHGREGVVAHLRELETGIKALEELKQAGEIQAIGAGINNANMIQRLLNQIPLDFLLVAMPYTLLDQTVLDEDFPACERNGVGVVIGAPYASGILVTGPQPQAEYNYGPANSEVLQKVTKMQQICARHGLPLAAAALQFPLAHPLVASVIPGMLDPAQVHQNLQWFQHPIPADCWQELRHEGCLHPLAPVPSPT